MRLKSVEAQEFRLQRIGALQQQGYSQTQIAHLVDCSQCWVSKALRRRREQGAAGLPAQGHAPGRPAALSHAQLVQLREKLLGEARAAGFAQDGWTRRRVAAVIHQMFGVRHDLSHISRLLRKLGFTLQTPRRRDYRHDPQAAQQWRTTDLPRLKKSGDRRAAALLRR